MCPGGEACAQVPAGGRRVLPGVPLQPGHLGAPPDRLQEALPPGDPFYSLLCVNVNFFSSKPVQDVSAVPVISAPDHRIELAGHIVGVAVARDGRHLYANVRRSTSP